MSDSEETLLEFPCRFPIKAMGRASDDFQTLVVDIVERHAPGVEATAISARPSNGGKWLAVTVTIEAHSKAQLDAIYAELTAHERVVWAL
ncbi:MULTISPECIES: YbeD family protein [Marichromatium]|uniref:UPF0250 protein EDC29_101288 n=1 Tax=Marichromatium gracile TaxID=1048 RepID=A0A4R4AKD1_MARGR|nr:MULTISPECIES: DUF493 domain-containing protein [Marichromatium]MBO8086518.1 DUF493 domain-containing protein [Marichromatium sp.]MBK1707521.1 transcriptional regulator [Marichromatium gracile]RNE92004.1 DUF493 domain-containing protein [Marichromatium sp. AB31]RNE94129.1 DUF493 domain-containing protein [Marichromatium sp. AB32]TCW39872.1 hypothetical protein EDC29_101288 [Marichromatium gracile]